MGTKCFFLEPTGRTRISLRRYVAGDSCPGPMGYHDARVPVDEGKVFRDERGYAEHPHGDYRDDDPRWPAQCSCGYVFTEEDKRQVYTSEIYRRIDNGEEMSLDEAPPGAMYFATWYESRSYECGPDGHALMVVCPGGRIWHVDGQCNNCTNPEDRVHKCWVRHGDPRQPETVTVDKNGHTCNAGAGSIQTANWHGFLRNGELVDA